MVKGSRVSDAARRKISVTKTRLWATLPYRITQTAALGSFKERKRRSEVAKRLWADPNYRKKQSEVRKLLWSDSVYRNKMSAVRKARWLDPEYRKKVIECRYGRAVSGASRIAIRDSQKRLWRNPKHRQKMSKAHIGFVPSEESRRKRSAALRGEKSHLWRGGVSDINCSLRENVERLFEYKQWRRLVFNRDNFTCQVCGRRGGKVVAHHVKPYNCIIKEYGVTTVEQAKLCAPLWDIDNGVTVCVGKCHTKIAKAGRDNLCL